MESGYLLFGERRIKEGYMKNFLRRIMPTYAWIMLIIVVSWNMFTYFGTRLFTESLYHYPVDNPIDDRIPFVPFFILFYLLAYVQWIVGFICIARESRDVCYRVLIAEVIAKTICLLCFVFLPTTIAASRPEIESIAGKGIWCDLTALIYRLDAPNNLFPSIHCLESWICFRGAMRLKRVPRWYTPVMFVFTLLVFASTVLVKQHVWFDILGGIAVVELGLLITKKLSLRKFIQET